MARLERLFGKPSKYGHGVGRIMVHEATMLNWQQVQRMVESDLEEALGVSTETVYGPYLAGAGSAKEVEDGLERFLADEYKFMDEVCAGTLVARFMHLKYDFHNLRVILKNHYFGDAAGDELLSRLGTISIERLNETIEQPAAHNLPDYVEGVLAVARSEMANNPSDPQRLDSLVDRAYLKERLRIAIEEGSSLLVDFCRATIDIANLRILLRGLNLSKAQEFYSEALAEGGRFPRGNLIMLAGQPWENVVDRLLESRYGHMLSSVLERGEGKVRLTSLDRASEEYLLEKLRGFSRVSVGPERIVRFMLSRENEVALLRIIFLGKLHALTPAAIEAQIPSDYLKAPSR
jgi:V/A-type H+/Na+-transporting ATPase subunit C